MDALSRSPSTPPSKAATASQAKTRSYAQLPPSVPTQEDIKSRPHLLESNSKKHSAKLFLRTIIVGPI